MLTSIASRAQSFIDAGYCGASVTHPGLYAGYGKTLLQVHGRGKKKNELVATVRLGFYFHRNRHTGVFTNVGLEWIKTTRRGFQYGLDVPVGYLRTFIPKVYKMNDDGELSKVRWAGTNHLIMSPAIRLGHTFSSGFINAWYIKNRVMIVQQYVGGSAPQFMLEAGVVKLLN
jgi:hypothetical protein